MFTLGSLFSGAGGFELAGMLHGIMPIWSSEIEKYPRAVTAERFPWVKQLGDVRGIDGGAVEPVDVITFGSPCQDLSTAAVHRAGLAGSRSSLFFEAVRIIREMKEATRNAYPRFAVWENVPGAFSSNGGRDFAAVLQAFCALCGYTDALPEPESKAGRYVWRRAGLIVGCGFSIAWRVLDAQYWGVPQRRKRIFLVADFAGERAGEILFDPEGMPWDTAAGRAAGQEIAGDAGGGAAGGCVPGVFHGLTATNARCAESAQQANCVAYALIGNCVDRADTAGCNGAGWSADVGYTLNTRDRHCVVFMAGQGGKAHGVAASGVVSPTLRGAASGTQRAPCLCMAADIRNGRMTETSGTLQAKQTGGHSLNYQNPVIYPMNQITSAACRTNPKPGDAGPALTTAGDATLVMATGQAGAEVLMDLVPTLNCNHEQPVLVEKATGITGRRWRKYMVRRLTPVECQRLMGMPDWWGVIDDARLWSDSAEYQMCGNGLALPCAAYVMRGIGKVGRG